MNHVLCECGENPKSFSFPHTQKNKTMWHICINHHHFENKYYRDSAVMYKEGCEDNDKIITIICFNPGTLHSNCGKKLVLNHKDSINGDSTLRNIREVFENSNHKLEILNIFNINEPEMEKVKEIYQNGEINKIKNNYLIEDYLSKHEEGHLVFIQWGKEVGKEYAKKEFYRIKNLLTEMNFKCESLDWVNEKHMHPRRWTINKEIIPEFKKRVEIILKRNLNEKRN